jgi:hypothetical protein
MTTNCCRPILTVALAAGLMGGCAYPAGKVPPGSSVADAMNAAGRPTGEYALPGGGKRLEYATGPMGRETWMLDFDASGKLVSKRQVLTEANFATVRNGISRDDLRLALGSPSLVRRLGRQNQTLWIYRFEHPFCLWYMVGMDPAGTVVDATYGPDPVCTPHQDK